MLLFSPSGGRIHPTFMLIKSLLKRANSWEWFSLSQITFKKQRWNCVRVMPIMDPFSCILFENIAARQVIIFVKRHHYSCRMVGTTFFETKIYLHFWQTSFISAHCKCAKWLLSFLYHSSTLFFPVTFECLLCLSAMPCLQDASFPLFSRFTE